MTRLRPLAAAILAGALLPPGAGGAQGQAAAPALQLEAKILLGSVRGRIDHMAFDLKRQRLFVAELGNDSVGVVDLAARKVVRRIEGLKEPQGTGYEPVTDTLYVANAKDGSVRLFHGNDYAPAGQIALGDDADNIRIDSAANRVFVGYGSGGLAVLDPTTGRKIGDIPLRAHPESFQLDSVTGNVFVNLPAVGAIAVVDRATTKQVANWPTAGRSANFPMALNHAGRHVLAVFRSPATLGVFAMADGAPVASIPSCGDSDDVFVDARRQLAYVSCGEGFLDVFDIKGGYARVAHIPTAAGARTSLFVSERDRLFLAVPARAETPAAIWVYRPAP
jgi:DNA-binding beta-propeller fold protein YncE